MDLIKLNIPKIQNITISNNIELNKQDNKSYESFQRDNKNTPIIEKLSNFISWEFTIYKTTETTEDFNTLKDSLLDLNNGQILDFKPDSSLDVSYKVKFFCYYTDISMINAKKIVCKVNRIYKEGTNQTSVNYLTDLLGNILTDLLGNDLTDINNY